MCSNIQFMALRLEGPFQSYGFDSQYNRRNTQLMPTKSAIAGMFCAALGYSRGSNNELVFLEEFNKIDMICIAIPRIKQFGKKLNVRRIQDYHTIGGGYNPNNPDERGSITISAEDGKPRAKKGQALAVLTSRQYLNDASFGVLLTGDSSLLLKLTEAIQNPVWGIWLGRKNCIPSVPVFAGLKDSKEKALQLLIGNDLLENYTHLEDVEKFAEGVDSLPDTAVSFGLNKRRFSPRRIRIIHGRE